MDEQFEFFWSGPFSQWYPSTFTVNGKTFNCAEQFMMYSKAIFFDDHDVAQDIMKSTNPKEQKKLGRRVSGFDVDKWNKVAKHFVYVGNQAKFSQNQKLYEHLMNTGDKTLVEASPYDAIWGIGLNEIAAKATPPDKWPGTNWLGEVLTNLRNDFQQDPIEWK